MSSSSTIDSALLDYFRLYNGGVEINDDDVKLSVDSGGRFKEMNNITMGFWNIFDSSNTTAIEAINITSMNSLSNNTLYKWTSSLIESFADMDSHYSSVFVVINSTMPTNREVTSGNEIGYEEGWLVDNNDITSDDVLNAYNKTRSSLFAATLGPLEITSFTDVEAEDDINLASVETAIGADNDYESSLRFNGVRHIGNIGSTSLNGHSTAFDSFDYNESKSEFYDSFDDGTTNTPPVENVINVADGIKTGSTFTMLLEDFGDYFFNYKGNGSEIGGANDDLQKDMLNCNGTDLITQNCTNITDLFIKTTEEVLPNYWALTLMVFPLLTLFGNILVILSVFRERSLQTVTNYFIVSLAIADLLVAVVVMPFAVYVLVNGGRWNLPAVVCDFYICMDVICSTSSIFNLVAISIDRYIAVTRPIEYARHRNSLRVCLTMLLVWSTSIAIGLPILLGLNRTDDRDPGLCIFYNTIFILCSSLSSFYIPCIIMVFLYWNIFKALRMRVQKQRAARRPHLSELTGGSVIENVAHTRRLAETALDSDRHAARIIPDEPATNTASGSNEEEEDIGGSAISPDIDDCHVIVNDKSTEFMLATVVEETGIVVAQISSPPQLLVADSNGNHDSGYAPSNVDDVLAGAAADSSPLDSPEASGTYKRTSASSSRRNTATIDSPIKREPSLSAAIRPLSFVRCGVQEAMTLARNDSTLSSTSKTSSRKDKKNSQASRFTIYKVHKASKKKREKSSAKKERKATKTLAIVLGVFLICWVPFFTCNVADAIFAIFEIDWRPGVNVFIFTTWLGYINSFVNPIIYTIFNPEFRKAFKKIMHLG